MFIRKNDNISLPINNYFPTFAPWKIKGGVSAMLIIPIKDGESIDKAVITNNKSSGSD